MKILGIILSLGLSLTVSSTANAETYTSLNDPSGAPMCFDTLGVKAELNRCEAQPKKQSLFLSSTDPSGATMCFNSLGQKAPLIKCEAQDKLVASVRRAKDILVAAVD